MQFWPFLRTCWRRQNARKALCPAVLTFGRPSPITFSRNLASDFTHYLSDQLERKIKMQKKITKIKVGDLKPAKDVIGGRHHGNHGHHGHQFAALLNQGSRTHGHGHAGDFKEQ